MTENFPLPTSYKYGKVVGRIIHAVADTPEDPDALPQAQPASGKVVFTPAEKIRKVVDADYPAIAMHETFESTLNAAGRITDSEGRVGIWLLEGIWRVEFKLDAGSIESYDIQVTDQHTDENPKDIISDVPYTPPTGVNVITMLIPSGGQPGQTLTPVSSGSNTLEWIDASASDLSGLVQTTDPRLSDARAPTAHDHPISGVTGLQAALDGKQPSGSYAPESHNHTLDQATDTATRVAMTPAERAKLSGVAAGAKVNVNADWDASSGDAQILNKPTIPTPPPDASIAVKGIVELATTAETTTGTDTARAVTPAGLKAVADTKQAAGSYAPTAHNHDDRYYTEAETDNLLVGKASSTHNHDATYAPASHNHDSAYATTAQGSKADTAIPATLVDAKGDLIVGTADNTVGRLAAGTDGHVLTRDSAEVTGVKWAEPAAGGGGAPTISLYASPQSGMYLPVYAVGGHANFNVVAGRLVPCPINVYAERTVDAVAVNVDGAATATLTVALYTFNQANSSATKVRDLAVLNATGAGLLVGTFTPFVLPPGLYVTVLHSNVNLTLWGSMQPLGIVWQKGPNGGTSHLLLPHATGTPPLPGTINFVDGMVPGAIVPKIQLRVAT